MCRYQCFHQNIKKNIYTILKDFIIPYEIIDISNSLSLEVTILARQMFIACSKVKELPKIFIASII